MKSKDVLRIYELLLKNNLVSFPIPSDSAGKIESVVTTITEPHFGVEIYPSVEEKVIAYLYFLIKNHPFTDGNKRTATITFLVLCDLNQLHANFSKFDLDQLAVFMEQSRDIDHQIMIKIISKLLFK